MSYKLQATRNYDLFEPAAFNRSVAKTTKLEASMRKFGYIAAYPMHVIRLPNGKLKIKDGHHRFEVARRLGIPIWYVICDDEASMFDLNGCVIPWTLTDYLDGYCRLGYEPYIKVREYVEATKISISQAIALLAGHVGSSTNFADRFKAGTYQIGDTKKAVIVGKVVAACREMKIPFATTANYVTAISLMAALPQFDEETFIKRLQMNLHLARKQAGVQQYLEFIEQIYNYRTQFKISLAFEAKEAAARRRTAILTKKVRTTI